MKIGFPTHPRRDLIKEIEWVGKNKFDFVELFLEEDMATPEKIDVASATKVIKQYNLGVIGHTAWYLPIGSSMRSLRETAVSEAEKYFDVFHRLNVKYVTVHANWPNSVFSEKEGVKFQVETLKRLVKTAKKYNIGLMYESTDAIYDNIGNVAKVLNEGPSLFFLLDCGHTNIFGRKPEEFIKRFHKKIKHIHLHDNFGKDDLHLPMGAGLIDWARVVRVMKKYYDGTITLEIFSREREYALLSKEKLRKMWDNAD